MRSIETVGKSIEEAVEQGLKELQLTKADVDIKIISKGGWFSKAKVRITETVDSVGNAAVEEVISVDTPKTKEEIKRELSSTPEKKEQKPVLPKSEKSVELKDKPKKEKKDLSKNKESTIKEKAEDLSVEAKQKQQEHIKVVQDFLKGLFKQTNTKAEIEIRDTPPAIILEIKTESASALIGHRGESLQALQSVVNAILRANNYTREDKKILIDVENYMDNQADKIQNKTKKAIENCLRTSNSIQLDFMNSYERLIVHETVTQDGRVCSESFGKEPRRFVKIFAK